MGKSTVREPEVENTETAIRKPYLLETETSKIRRPRKPTFDNWNFGNLARGGGGEITQTVFVYKPTGSLRQMSFFFFSFFFVVDFVTPLLTHTHSHIDWNGCWICWIVMFRVWGSSESLQHLSNNSISER